MEREQALTELLLRFARPGATSRVNTGGAPEDDMMKLEVKAGDWMRACVAIGDADADYYRALPAHAVPSEAFLASLSVLSPKCTCDRDGYCPRHRSCGYGRPTASPEASEGAR